MMKQFVMVLSVLSMVGLAGCQLSGLAGLLGGSDVDLSNFDPAEVNGGVSSGSGPHLERNGRVVVEAEHLSSSGEDDSGGVDWYVQQGAAAGPGPDPDGFHDGASGNTYVELLPDIRVTHSDPLTPASFSDEGDGAAWVNYDIIFETAGTYYVWGRIHSTGTEDNGLHVGVGGVLPESGKKMQWCANGFWAWSNAKRESGGAGSCGVNGTITVNIPSPGLHTITFWHREDGIELDRFLMTTDPDYTPFGAGPVESPHMNP